MPTNKPLVQIKPLGVWIVYRGHIAKFATIQRPTAEGILELYKKQDPKGMWHIERVSAKVEVAHA